MCPAGIRHHLLAPNLPLFPSFWPRSLGASWSCFLGCIPMGLWACPAVTRGDHDPVCEEVGDSGCNGVLHPVGCSFGTHCVFHTKLPQNGSLVTLSIHILGWGDIGTCNCRGLLVFFLQGRKKIKERGEKISKTRDAIAYSQRTDGAIRGQILRRK